MKKFLATGVMLATMVLLLGATQQMQAQSKGIPDGRSAPKVAGPLLVTKNCSAMAKISFAATNGLETATTTSVGFVDLPGMSATFTIPGTATTCLKVELAAVVFAPGSGDLIYMRVLLDGVELLPGELQFSGEDDENGNGAYARAHAANFFTNAVAPGAHTVTAQWSSFFGTTVFAHWRSMAVHHK